MVGGRAAAELAGGVRDLGSSCELADREDPGMPRSGDAVVGVARGIDPSNNSARSSVLYVRFACSASRICQLCIDTAPQRERDSLRWKFSSPWEGRLDLAALEGVPGSWRL